MKRQLGAILIMLCGSASVFGLLLVMNNHSTAPENDREPRAVDFSVAPTPKPPKKKPRPRPKPKKADVKRPQAPPAVPNLASSLSTVSLGLPGLDPGSMGAPGDELLGETRASVMTEDAVDQRPRPVRRTAAPYPPRARAQGVTGHVTLSLLIDERGAVTRVRVVNASPAGTFEDAARTAVESWRFEPATYNGEPVKVWATQTIRFDLT